MAMRQILYKFNTLGAYETKDNTAFGSDETVQVIVEPHEFSLELSGQVLRSSSCPGCTAEVSNSGAVVFCDAENNVIGSAEGGADVYPKFRLQWKQDLITIQFGQMVEVDNYPNCDGESDRWSMEWWNRRTVTLDLKSNTVEVK